MTNHNQETALVCISFGLGMLFYIYSLWKNPQPFLSVKGAHLLLARKTIIRYAIFVLSVVVSSPIVGLLVTNNYSLILKFTVINALVAGILGTNIFLLRYTKIEKNPSKRHSL